METQISGQIYQPQSTMESLDKYLALVCVWLFFAAASLARIGSGSLAGMGEFWGDIFQISHFFISGIPAGWHTHKHPIQQLIPEVKALTQKQAESDLRGEEGKRLTLTFWTGQSRLASLKAK